MRNRQLLGKWLLIITCVAMAICLVQRAVYLNHFLQGLDPQTTLIADAPVQTNDAEPSGPSPCQLGAHSLLCAQPLFFDGALPAIIIFFALLQLFTQGRACVPREQPVQAPPPRIHLKNCVFRE
ncbi:TPA: hypothetical protein ACW0NO_000269 [Enterobacter ludwigii]|jgi:uncharacterized membrane protein|uniref:hypothetical protein n=1 Tax=Enterobacter ludwigii TaxID=299767 RepID=UPI00064ACC05|nr:hypothetical protein [Enterobacter ludwigii]KYO05602.1 hypothetical protein ABR30_0219150 [Enterobacter ludwigii]MDR0164411.1 hypothetical protein [Enterobacter ludwigii]